MAASDLVGVRGQVMEYMYIPTGIKREMAVLMGGYLGEGEAEGGIFDINTRAVGRIQ